MAATVLAMLVVGAIVTGGFYAASQEGQVSRATTAGDDALFIAETGMNSAMAQTTPVTAMAIPINGFLNGTATNVTVGTQTIGTYVTRVNRVADRLFVITSRAVVTRGGRYSGAAHQLASLVRIRTADLDTHAAVMVYGNLSVAGNAEVDGNDYYPSNWTGVGCAVNTGTSAVLTNPTTTVTAGGSSVINGPITRDTLTAADFTVFGDITWNDLVGMREKTVSGTINPGPVFSGSVCTTANVMNWGSASPTNPCYNYFPIIYAPGDLNISSSGEGQGILLVEGDLDVTGGFNFYGVAIVRGSIRIPGTGGHINGTTLTFGDGQISTTSSTSGNSLLQYSSCAIQRAVLNNTNLTRLAPITGRSWMDISAISGGN